MVEFAIILVIKQRYEGERRSFVGPGTSVVKTRMTLHKTRALAAEMKGGGKNTVGNEKKGEQTHKVVVRSMDLLDESALMKKIDKGSLVLFSISFFIFNVIYFLCNV